jgi:hypothetical protein
VKPDFIVEEIPCCKCGAVTVLYALTFAALPRLDTYVGSCCRVYKEEPCSDA